MDFFDKQHQSRRLTLVLVVMFLIVTCLYVGSYALLGWLIAGADGALVISVLVGCILLYGSFNEWQQLHAQGGHAIAKRVGAKRLFYHTSRDALNMGATDTEDDQPAFTRSEERLLQAVENMAIASSMRMPATFIMPNEQSINAFVAGYKEHDMVLVATQGAVEKLNEDELYGLIGHEFSHITHGDTRLNLRLLVMLGGLQLIYEMAESVTSLYNIRDIHYLKSYDRSNVSAFYMATFLSVCSLILVSIVVLLFSGIGVFCARMVKFAVVRQREYLADAASVQYTRSHGVLNALVKVRDCNEHGGIRHPSAESLSHFFFVKAIPDAYMFSGLLSTHPAIDKRIRRISESEFERLLLKDKVQARAEIHENEKALKEALQLKQQNAVGGMREKSTYDGTPVEFVTQVGIAGAAMAFSEPLITKQKDCNSVDQGISTQHHANLKASAPDNQQPENTITPSLVLSDEADAGSRHVRQPRYDVPCNKNYIPPFTVSQALSDSKGCFAVIAAALACHQQRPLDPESYDVSRVLFDVIRNDQRDHDIVLIYKALQVLDSCLELTEIPPRAVRLYLQRLYRITMIDDHVSLLEHLLLDKISHHFGYLSNLTGDLTQDHIAHAFDRLVDTLLTADGHSPDAISRLKTRMSNLANIDPLPDNVSSDMSLTKSLSLLALQSAEFKSVLLETLETTMLSNGRMSLDQHYILSLLEWRFEFTG